ncbi:hypothetical protein EV131_1095 [Rhizobium laguerreae]|jgi:hypothetical protein|uniref:Uncharacterized protein n=1 Tax=Rhizobium laguerreae TaxID=1076926 RepID=A0AAX2QH88_9HYPH|nr:hypothetical protein EV131_1095 [Rhizobium laguerreae]
MNLTLPIDDAFEPHHASSPTDRFIYEMQIYGHRPFQDEPDPRPLPEEPVVQSALTAIFDALFEMLGHTRLEPDLENLLWSMVNLFHRAGERIQRELQRNEDAQRIGQREQDGSEVKSVELERLLAEGITFRTPQRLRVSCATTRPTSSRLRPDRHGGRAPAPRSATPT